MLRAQPSKAGVAIGELLRAYPAVTTLRICRNPYTLDGVTIMPGDYVAMSTPLAGRDPDLYDQPNEVRLDRSEEHTSELQSLMRISYAVFCLKKKNKHTKIILHTLMKLLLTTLNNT